MHICKVQICEFLSIEFQKCPIIKYLFLVLIKDICKHKIKLFFNILTNIWHVRSMYFIIQITLTE